MFFVYVFPNSVYALGFERRIQFRRHAAGYTQPELGQTMPGLRAFWHFGSVFVPSYLHFASNALSHAFFLQTYVCFRVCMYVCINAKATTRGLGPTPMQACMRVCMYVLLPLSFHFCSLLHYLSCVFVAPRLCM